MSKRSWSSASSGEVFYGLWTAAFSILITILLMAPQRKAGGISAHIAEWEVGWYTCGIRLDFSFSFFKHSKWEAKNLFHLGAIKWIPESLAPARRRSSFPPALPPPPPPLVLLPISSPSRQQKECSLFSQSHISSAITQGPPWLSASQCFPKHARRRRPPSSSSKHWQSVMFQHLCGVIKNIHP